MAVGVKFTLTGNKALDRKFQSLPVRVQKKVLRGAVRNAAKLLQAPAKANTPAKSGRARKAIKVRAMKRTRTARVGATVITSAKSFPGGVFYGAPLDLGHRMGSMALGGARKQVRGKKALREAFLSEGDHAKQAAIAEIAAGIEQEAMAQMARTTSKIKEWLKAQLETFAVVRTFAAGDTANAYKVFPVFIPQIRLIPAVTYRRLRTGRDQTMRGSDGIAKPVFRINCWSTDHDEADVCCDALLAFANYRPPTGEFVRRVEVADQGDEFYDPEDGSDLRIFGPFVDLQITHAETVGSYGERGA